jgi:hypothetical protein
VLCAPTAFGKTVTAAALIARRKVSTLVLVHRTELLRQWQERLTGFLEIPKGGLGVIGGGKKKPSGKIDIAVMQSLSRREDLGELLDQYGQIIIDDNFARSEIGRTSVRPKGARHGRRASMPPPVGVFLRGDPQTGQGKIRGGPDRHPDTPRRASADHLHAVRADPPQCIKAGNRPGATGGLAEGATRAGDPA